MLFLFILIFMFVWGYFDWFISSYVYIFLFICMLEKFLLEARYCIFTYVFYMVDVLVFIQILPSFALKCI